MAKVKKVRISAVIEPAHRAYIDGQVDLPGYTFGEVVRELLEEAIAAREARKVNA